MFLLKEGENIPSRSLSLWTLPIFYLLWEGLLSGWNKLCKNRISKRSLGFSAKIKTQEELSRSEILSHLEPPDLIQYGLIPEFIGRLPGISILDSLDKSALIRILQEPKNAPYQAISKTVQLQWRQAGV